MTDKWPDATSGVDGGISLASAVDLGTWQAESMIDLPMLAPSPVHVIDPEGLGEILADSLIADPVDISDLLPGVLEPSSHAVLVPVLEDPADRFGMAGDLIDLPDAFFAPTVTLASLFDDADKGHIAL